MPLALTPEQRAIAVVEELDCVFHGERAGVIAAAIRAAENDALDRAAEIGDWLDDPMKTGKRIRALKT